MEMKKYALYGAGEYGRAAYHLLSSAGEVSCWVDGDSRKWGTEIFGKAVISLDDWQKRKDASVLVLTCNTKYQQEIEKELKDRGIRDYSIFNRLDLCNRPRLVSYSHPHELEDLVLYPVLEDEVAHMFYIDVGCNDPFSCSVTKLYYDMGAHGINIDPVQEYIRMAELERLRDINLCLGIGEQPGAAEIFINSGLTTMRQNYVEPNGCVGKRMIKVDTLANICSKYVPEGQPIHLLKIDVEGWELQVIKGMDWQNYRPWVLCIESTLPCTDIPCYDEWEHDVLSAGYQLAFTYGVNRYYVANEKQELVQRFLPVEQILQHYYVFQATLNRM